MAFPLGFKMIPKSIQDRFDTSKGSQEASKTDFRALKSRPKAFDSAPRSLPKGVLEAPKRLLVRLLDRLRHHQEGFITIQTHSDLFFNSIDQFLSWLRRSELAVNSSEFITHTSQVTVHGLAFTIHKSLITDRSL